MWNLKISSHTRDELVDIVLFHKIGDSCSEEVVRVDRIKSPREFYCQLVVEVVIMAIRWVSIWRRGVHGWRYWQSSNLVKTDVGSASAQPQEELRGWKSQPTLFNKFNNAIILTGDNTIQFNPFDCKK